MILSIEWEMRIEGGILQLSQVLCMQMIYISDSQSEEELQMILNELNGCVGEYGITISKAK